MNPDRQQAIQYLRAPHDGLWRWAENGAVLVWHDGTTIALRKLNAEYDVHDRLAAMTFLQHHAAEGQIVTGLLYVDSDPDDLHSHLATVETPLNALTEKELCPGSATLDKFNASLR